MNQDKSEKKPKKKPVSYKRKEQSRREFLRATVLTAGVVTASLMGMIPVVEGAMPPRAKQAIVSGWDMSSPDSMGIDQSPHENTKVMRKKFQCSRSACFMVPSRWNILSLFIPCQWFFGY